MTEVVVLGGGYGGLRFIESLAPLGEHSITLIDRNPYHYLQTEAYEFLSGRKNICDITFNLESFCSYYENVRFVRDEAVALGDGEVVCRRGSYRFDKLVIAVGAKDLFPKRIVGLEEYSPSIKELSSAFMFKQRLLEILFREVTDQSPARVVVGGGGLSGVELAADLASVVRECRAEAGQSPLVEVVLIEAAHTLLPGSSSFLREETERRLRSLSVEIRLASPIQWVDGEVVHLEHEVIPYDLFIFTGGIAAQDFIQKLPHPKGSGGRLIVDPFLRIAPDIYAIGDCALITDSEGRELPPTAQIAEQSAEYAARHIAGRAESPFSGRIYGIFIALGKGYAVGELFGIFKLKGRVASWIKEAITRLYAFGIRLRVNSGYRKRYTVNSPA
ncbi:MAG: FAD-dependent oxidoreductase [Epsilonproteobacteria bacterium]|nr:FAD-dependent oxidoreductase [Campylobacterota bacterium]